MSQNERTAAVDRASQSPRRTEERGSPVRPPAVLTVDETATLLRVDRKTVYRAILQGKIPGVRRLGRTIRLSRGAVLDWLNSGGIQQPPE